MAIMSDKIINLNDEIPKKLSSKKWNADDIFNLLLIYQRGD